MIIEATEVTRVASKVLEETRKLGELSEREYAILHSGFHKLMRGLTPRAADEGYCEANCIDDPNKIGWVFCPYCGKRLRR